MSALHPVVPLIGTFIALGSLAWSLRQRRRHRLLADLPTSKVRGVFIGLVELKGSAESEAPLRSYLAGKRCVDYKWSVEEHWRRTTTESYTDSKGKRRTRTKTTTGWSTVASGGDAQSFYLQDDTGLLLIHPRGARVDRTTLFSSTVGRSHALYYGKGPAGGVSGSTGQRRFVERGIPLHAPLYVVGDAREREDIVAPRIADAPGAEFIISTRAEESVRARLAVGSWFLWALGLVAMPAAFFIGVTAADIPAPWLPAWSAIAVAVYLAIWGFGWAWMAHDSLVGLRERVRQARSLIDVQLKRRHDLLPAINRAVSALSAHEKDVQTTLAALRAQAQTAGLGDTAGPRLEGVAGVLRAVIERHPELRAQEGFAALERELIDTEQRIALARTYYNDIATHYATRLEIVPDRAIASLRKLAPEPLLEATGFERAAVKVDLAE